MSNLTNSAMLINKIKDIEKSFIVVNELPSIENADKNKIYIIKNGDRFEEWIVKEGEGHFISESEIHHEHLSGDDYLWNQDGEITNVYIGVNNTQMDPDYGLVFINDTGSSDSCNDIYEDTPMPWVGIGGECQGGGLYEHPVAWSWSGYNSLDLYYSESPLTWSDGGFVWSKISETNEDSHDIVDSLPQIEDADENKAYIVEGLGTYIVGYKPTGTFESTSQVTVVDLDFSLNSGDRETLFDGSEQLSGDVFFGISGLKTNASSLKDSRDGGIILGSTDSSEFSVWINDSYTMPAYGYPSGRPSVMAIHTEDYGTDTTPYEGTLKFYYSSNPISWNPAGGEIEKTWIKISDADYGSDVYVYEEKNLNEFRLKEIYELWKKNKTVCIYSDLNTMFFPYKGSLVSDLVKTYILFHGCNNQVNPGGLGAYTHIPFEELHIIIGNNGEPYTREIVEKGMDYLDANHRYSDAYNPKYDCSPTSKKYVDDRDAHIGSAQPTSNKVEGRLWYDTTNDVLKSYDGTKWNLVGDAGTKVFYLQDSTDYTTALNIVNYADSGKIPIVVYDDSPYIFFRNISGIYYFMSNRTDTVTNNSYSTTSIRGLKISTSGGSITDISRSGQFPVSYLSTGTNYSTPYTPQYNGSPATKKYVDDSVSVVSDNSGVVYHIKVSNSDPASGTASNIITLVP